MDEKIGSADCTVRSQESNISDLSKDSGETGDSKTESCRASKHSKEILIQENFQSAEETQEANRKKPDDILKARKKASTSKKEKDDTNVMILASCGQLLLGLVLVVFGVLVLVHGASLSSSGAGLWAGAGALVAGALGLVATLAETTSKKSSRTTGFSTAHLASSLVALALSNMSTITALTAVVRDVRSAPQSDVLLLPTEDEKLLEVEPGWAGLLASIGLLLTSLIELLVAGYTCVTLTPKLCGCLSQQRLDNQIDSVLEVETGAEYDGDTGKLKRRNMVHQWVIAQTHTPKTPPPPPPFYVVHPPMVPMHQIIQAPYGIPHGKYPGPYIPTYGHPLQIIPHLMGPSPRPPMHMHRPRRNRSSALVEREEASSSSVDRRASRGRKSGSPKRMTSIGEDENVCDLSQTYTGLDKKISEEFISICMDPERKSKASSHHGSEIGAPSVTKNS